MDKLLQGCQRLALGLHFLLLPMVILAVVALYLFGWQVFVDSEVIAVNEKVPLATGMWAMLCALFIYSFRDISIYDADFSWWQRVKCRVKQLVYLMLVIILLAITLALLMVTFRFIRT